MEQLTIVVAILTSVLVLFVRPVYALILYVACFVYYPTFLAVPLGTIDFTVRRVVIMALLVRAVADARLVGRFRWLWPDKAILVYFALQIFAGAMNGAPLGRVLENRAGAAFDMVLPYFVTRLIITEKRQYVTLLKGILVLAAPVALAGLYQSMTGRNIAGVFEQYYAWSEGKQFTPISRLGFYRANVTFSHSIMFGLFFSMFGPVCLGLLKQGRKHKNLYIAGLLMMGVGIFSSMSSGPLLGVVAALGFMSLYRYRGYWRQILVATAVIICLIEIASNRHFHHVVGRFTLSGETAWYRSRLIDVALFEGGMSGHWVVGFPYGMDPGWCYKIDGRNHTDIVNEYISVLYQFGLVGLIPFLVLLVGAIVKLIESLKSCVTEPDRWLVWCLMSALFGTLMAVNSVSLFDQPTTIFYMILGLCGATAEMTRKASLEWPSIQVVQGHKGITTY